jgi:crotonobetainyl-CoA:carnitine CoA-transferase CaiB-like acyl-CoA transferase
MMVRAGEESAFRPLDGYVVLDVLDGTVKALSRTYADLGARVIRVRPLGGERAAGDRREAIVCAVADAGKELVTLAHAPGERSAQWRELLQLADLVLVPSPRAAELNFPPEAVPERCVLMTVSMFGTGNAYADWQATDPVLHALSSELSRSGVAGREPLLPPGRLAFDCAMTQATYVGMAAIYAARVTGRGDRIDFSMLDGAVQALDPGFGLAGSATLGRSAKLLPPGRPAPGLLYPIFPCADGQVRVCLLAPRQWQNMFRWLGSPTPFASAEFNSLEVRQQSGALTQAMAAFFRHRLKADLEREGAEHGVPISGVLSLAECLATDHVTARGIIAEVALPDGHKVRMPRGVIGIDRHVPSAAPAGHEPASRPAGATPARPLAGLKVIDLGVIVVGGEQSRLLADLGADVVKVESASFPDGTRHSYLRTGLSVGFAAGHRNKRSLGLDLRHPDGKALFLRLAGEADVILSNFKPGTMESLGFDYTTISGLNPGVVMVDSSAFGADGPWAGRMGYGPLVRAASGLTRKWCYPNDAEAFSDSVTIYPDHAAARYGAIATLALLTRRLRTGRGGTASISQMEVMLEHFAPEIVGLANGVEDWDEASDAPWGVFPARGDDEWCVVTVRGDRDWQALSQVVCREDWATLPQYADRHGRLRNRAAIERDLTDWIARQDADAVMRRLQAAGVPAARMLRIADLPEFGYFRERRLFRAEKHPHLAEEVVSERFHAPSSNIADLPATPAPLMGEHSAEVVRDWLALPPDEIEHLFTANALQGVAPEIARMLAEGQGRGEAAVTLKT